MIMAKGCQDQEGFAGNLREKLALAVREIEWSYAIFWSISSSQPVVLEWGDGYYNGDIKTRKTVQATEISDDQLGLQRTEHLRELYESLLAGEANPQAKMHSAALSPEDLTDSEWYFLVCMSFLFNIGQGLPGRALSKNQSIWLCNAHQADSKTFSRSLLAKSASIQTVVCFPYLGGVVELGATEHVSEDLNLIHHVKTSYLDKNNPVPPVECEYNNISSPHKYSNGFIRANQEEPDSFMADETNGEPSKSWKLAEDDTINCIHNSTNSSDCISQNYVNPEHISTLSDVEKVNRQSERGVDVHYQSILSNVLKSSHQLILGPYFRGTDRESCFVAWKNEVSSNIRIPRSGTPQRLLKKVLVNVARMHGCSENNLIRPEAYETDRSRILSERRRREKLSERFGILASMIPNPRSDKVDKISILDETIEYIKQLERKVREVESQMERLELESCDDVERTSDNCGDIRADKAKNSLPLKRKAPGVRKGRERNSSAHDVSVNVTDKDVAIEMRCQWSEGILVKIVQTLKNLDLDCYGIRSSKTDGILSVNIEAKMGESKVASTSQIRQALQRLK